MCASVTLRKRCSQRPIVFTNNSAFRLFPQHSNDMIPCVKTGAGIVCQLRTPRLDGIVSE
jgi:hypothetical protein